MVLVKHVIIFSVSFILQSLEGLELLFTLLVIEKDNQERNDSAY
jgi:hypothetical protein